MASSIFEETFKHMNWSRKKRETPPQSDPHKGIKRNGQWLEFQFVAAHRRLKNMREEGKYYYNELYLDYPEVPKRGKTARLTVITFRKERADEKKESGRPVISRDRIFGPGAGDNQNRNSAGANHDCPSSGSNLLRRTAS